MSDHVVLVLALAVLALLSVPVALVLLNLAVTP